MSSLPDFPDDPLWTEAHERVRGALAPYLVGSPLERAVELTGVVGGGVFRAAVRDVVARTVVDEDLLAVCARWSQWHPLGFVKVLVLSNAAFQVRMNYWPEVVGEREDIHDHRFDFVSTVVHGALVAESYEYASVEGVRCWTGMSTGCRHPRRTRTCSTSPTGWRCDPWGRRGCTGVVRTRRAVGCCTEWSRSGRRW
ncbi:hypothetical protein [Actinokineospora terrae]|uniref:Uncharacterized protein n=1 Tax=Actinokineospora terrae TaxID=155974 RepID=A0A1H9X6K5_9PSEU|nr:hypothetical protein [Actinokineospora terrae]SES41691.1 hypothetical protein SAMN04487818_11335 [Actinokineospora terrae]